MASSENALIAIEVIKEIAGEPEAGAIKELLTALQEVATPTKEVRVVAPKETR